ncbi:hypothetical protein A5893_01935 [Pedobacter psychrophilus]|uniref:Asparagine synthetase B n=1 Tax=Pedobacter psychrophilus TaxID=1826909 RepID=A0A179DM56_9SPHI|nr:DUF2911 domain-containing protein [Pedobacter psychrophilus]OAQ41902.1 hypothetical protein A5893_01935 [Pedobacter psychrophilus]
MKKRFSMIVAAFMLFAVATQAQTDKSKRPSPPAKVSETLKSGVMVSIDYSQPAVKGRVIGTTDFVPYGKVWRTGANEATVFEVNKEVKVNGKTLPAGKYGLYSIPGEKEWTIIFNKTWNQWGTKYSQAEDALRITAKPEKTSDFMEMLTFKIEKDGDVEMIWGNTEVEFKVK